jgi:hypothetical protein
MQESEATLRSLQETIKSARSLFSLSFPLIMHTLADKDLFSAAFKCAMIWFNTFMSHYQLKLSHHICNARDGRE